VRRVSPLAHPVETGLVEAEDADATYANTPSPETRTGAREVDAAARALSNGFD
jgi:hypothetical protein